MSHETDLPSTRRILEQDEIEPATPDAADGEAAGCEVRKTLSKLRVVLQVRGE